MSSEYLERGIIMKKEYLIGTIVAYEKEKKEWQIIKGELTNEGVLYTIKKIDGQNIGRIETVFADVLDQ